MKCILPFLGVILVGDESSVELCNMRDLGILSTCFSGEFETSESNNSSELAVK
jgi:hypothetical protein